MRRGRRDLLAHVSLSAHSGEFIVLLGPSGSGKSTLIKSLLGLTRISSGHVLVNGQPRPPQAWEGALGYVPQDDIVHSASKVEDALRFAAQLRLGPDAIGQKPEKILRQLGLWEHRRQRIRTFSGGQRKQVSMAPLATIPQVLFSRLILPESTLSGWAKPVEKLMILRWSFDGADGILQSTWRWQDLLQDVAALCGFIAAFGLLTVWLVRQQDFDW